MVIRSYQAASDKLLPSKIFERILYSTGGVVAMFAVMVAVYILSSAVKVRADVTAETNPHADTGHPRKSWPKLDSRVTMRFYCSQGDNGMPPQFKAYAHRVQDLLNEYVDQAKGKLLSKNSTRKPDSDAESARHAQWHRRSARAQWRQDLSRPCGQFVERKICDSVPRAGSRTLVGIRCFTGDLARHEPSRPAIGIMSGLPVFGEGFNPMMHADQQRREDWAFVAELKKDFIVVPVPLNATNIDPHIKLLFVYHPVKSPTRANTPSTSLFCAAAR